MAQTPLRAQHGSVSDALVRQVLEDKSVQLIGLVELKTTLNATFDQRGGEGSGLAVA